jgi:hypothetical protein
MYSYIIRFMDNGRFWSDSEYMFTVEFNMAKIYTANSEEEVEKQIGKDWNLCRETVNRPYEILIIKYIPQE